MKKILLVLTLLLFPLAVTANDGLNSYYELAEEFVGMPGDCFVTANKYLKKLYNDDNFRIKIKNYEVVSHDEAQPGDVVFYENGSLNTTHWAVYLGEDTALQGNWGGVAVIRSVYIKGGSSPIFYRLKSSEKVTVNFDLLTLE